ncbi:sulfatase-like hydrolase/transferase [Armatimonas sp.]|uniref:sulfatase-like hydrolase/transferase n=1 Tax=Armatimonas sp. TaxID=1872638 RepID=UPI0037503AA3
MQHSSFLNLCAFALTLGTLTEPARAQAPPTKPNVLFIAVDDLRPELGCYGNTVIKSPNIDRLAKSGMVFLQAYCQQAVCSPSRSSLLTGRRPDATKVWDLVTHFRAALPDAVTLPQTFKQNGYHTAALNKIYHHGYEDGRSWSEPHWYSSGQTIDTDQTDYTKRTVVRVPGGVKEFSKELPTADADDPKAKKGPAFERSPKPEDQLPDGAAAAEAVKRLHSLKQTGKPFFLAVGMAKPHLPFISPQKYWDLYDPSKIPGADNDTLPEGAPKFAGHDNGELHGYPNIPAGNPISPELSRELRHGYYAAISYMDAQVGKVLDALKAEGLDKNTIVVLWGDHGWQLGDHGLWHKHTNFERATHAPLIISVPGMKNAGKKTVSLAEFVDIYPTLAELAGLSVPVGLDGTSLKPILDNPSASVKKVAISQYPRSADGEPVMGYSVRDPRWRLTLWRSRKTNATIATELYDEQNDPKELVNVASKPENAVIIARLTAELEVAYKGIGAVAIPKILPAAKPATDRNILFDKRDTNKDGKLTFEEFMMGQKDPEQAKERFAKFDANKDGVLSREEFVKMGKQS